MLGTHMPATVVMGPRNGVPATRASRGAPRGDDSIRAFGMIVLFTDFGLHGHYTGQMKAVLHRIAPGIPTIDLFADAPASNPKAAAYLLAAYSEWFAAGDPVFFRRAPRRRRPPPPRRPPAPRPPA